MDGQMRITVLGSSGQIGAYLSEYLSKKGHIVREFDIVSKISGKPVEKKHVKGPLGVRGRNSNNDLIREKLDWDYSMTLEEGIEKTFNWIHSQVYKDRPMYHPV